MEQTWSTAPNLEREMEAARRLATEAGRVILRYYKTGLQVDRKAHDEPVTAADRAADDLIRAGLQREFPADGLMTEESSDDRSRLEKERVWIVDPLDGTAEFIAATDEFAVQIALAIGGQPALGVVYQPAKGQLLYAARGQGAYRLQNGKPIRLRVSNQSDPSLMCMVASRSHYTSVVEAARRMLGIKKVNRLGSVGLKVALLALGECDLYVATTVVKEWDLCAPHALLTEAGGVLTNLCGEPLLYNKADSVACTGLVGSNGLAHDQIVATLTLLRDRQVEA